MIRPSFKPVRSPNSGLVILPISFHLDGVNSDGYVSNFGTNDGYGGDAYGGGVKGVIPIAGGTPGEFEVWLQGVYKGCVGALGSVAVQNQKDLEVQFYMPLLETRTGTDGYSYSVARIRTHTGGVATDPAAQDQVTLCFLLDTSGARI